MIPRIIHYVWVGDKPLPRKYEVNIRSWRETNPEFEIRAWTNETVDRENAYLDRCFTEKNWANASNYLRFMALNMYGGVYLDTDVMLIRPLKPMLKHNCFFGFQSEERESDWVNNAVFGAVPGHWFIRLCMDRLVAEFDGTEPANHSAPRLVTRLLLENGLVDYRRRGVNVKDIKIYPQKVFYPHRWNEAFSFGTVTDKTIAVHFWDKTWHEAPEGDSSVDTKETLRESFEIAEAALQHLTLQALQFRTQSIWKRLISGLYHPASG